MNSKDFDKLGNTLLGMIKDKSVPKFIFHYTNVNKHLYESLLNSELWFATPKSFNDPFDCKYDNQTPWNEELVRKHVCETISHTGEQVDPEDVVRSFKAEPDLFSKYVSDRIKEVTSGQGVFCCSESAINVLMWSHYADKHRGVCIKLDISKDINLFEHSHKVKYYWKYPKFDFFKENDLANRLFAKSRHWEYEEEIRTVKMKPGLYKFNKECLKEIIFGINSNPKEIKIIKKIVESKYNNVKFKRIQFKKHSFKIKFEKI